MFGGKLWNLKGNVVFLYIKTHNKLWEFGQLGRKKKKKIFQCVFFFLVLGLTTLQSWLLVSFEIQENFKGSGVYLTPGHLSLSSPGKKKIENFNLNVNNDK